MERSPPVHPMERPLGVVHAIVDLDVIGERGLRNHVRPLLDAGLPSLLLRGKGRPAADLQRAGEILREETERTGALMVVHGDAILARTLGVAGLHLPASGPTPTDVRRELPADMLVGTSCHDAEELRRAQGADWVFVSPVFATRSKPGAEPLGREGITRLAGAAPAPAYALGGVDRDNFVVCLEAGAAGVAAIRGFRGRSGVSLVQAAMRWIREETRSG